MRGRYPVDDAAHRPFPVHPVKKRGSGCDITCMTLVILGCGALVLGRGEETTKPHRPPDQRRTGAFPSICPSRPTRCVKEINSVNAYQKPNLSLKLNDRYAHTVGRCRAVRRGGAVQTPLPAPDGIRGRRPGHTRTGRSEDREDRFCRAHHVHRVVATGGKSHEEDLGIKMLQGAQLAIEQANAAGGYHARKIPFELVVKNDNGLWGATGNEIINMTYKDKVWAILGTIDGANTHIAIRVALKLEIPMMNSGDLDPTLMETNIPWIIRCVGDDRQQGYMLVDYLYRNLQLERVGIIRASNRYGRFGVREIKDGSRRLGHPIAIEMAYKLGTKDFSLQLERVEASNVQAVVHWGDAADGAMILNQMRARGMKQPFFACDRCTPRGIPEDCR